MKLYFYVDLFSSPLLDIFLPKNGKVFEPVLIHSGNLKKMQHEISNVRNFVFLNLYINSVGMKLAQYLMDKNVPIYAVPGDVMRYSSRGTNFLVQTGTAQIVTCAEDILSFCDAVKS